MQKHLSFRFATACKQSFHFFFLFFSSLCLRVTEIPSKRMERQQKRKISFFLQLLPLDMERRTHSREEMERTTEDIALEKKPWKTRRDYNHNTVNNLNLNAGVCIARAFLCTLRHAHEHTICSTTTSALRVASRRINRMYKQNVCTSRVKRH